MPRAVIALGGNAVTPHADASFNEQLTTIRKTVDRLATLHGEGYDLLLTHGNGPQVGNRLLEQEAADTPDMPLDVLVAETQAQLGALIQRALDAALEEDFLTLVTQAEVDPNDPAFHNPTKPVGPFYTADEAAEKDFETADVGRGERSYRRVVPSPEPQNIVESEEIAAMLERGQGVICGGGGGVPVTRDEKGIEGVSAVIDKDYTTQRLATNVDADRLVFVTDVDHIYLNYGTEQAEPLERVRAAELREYHEEDHFPAGSMGPKVESILRYLDHGGDRAIVTEPESLEQAVTGEAGTHIRP